MTQRKPLELFVSERPVRSVDALEKKYARRRVITIVVLAALMGGGAYAWWGRQPSNPADIPTIKAEGQYRQKPTDPGGINIPNQDVRVYDQLDGKNTAALPVEHLLPLPEEPRSAPPALAAALVSAPAPEAASSANGAPTEVAPMPASHTLPATDILTRESTVKKINTTAAPASLSAPIVSPLVPVASAPVLVPSTSAAPTLAAKEPSTITQVITTAKLAPSASANVALQLASVPDETQAKAMAADLQKKYASQLRQTSLHVVRADLGSKGIYYRIQSNALAESEATGICSSLKQIHAGCLLVRK